VLIFVGHRELIDALAKDERLARSKAAMNGLEDLKLLFKYCDLMGILDKVWLTGTCEIVCDLIIYLANRQTAVSLNIQFTVYDICIWIVFETRLML